MIAARGGPGVQAMDNYVDLENGLLRQNKLPTFEVGDSVEVQVLIKEGEKERIQIFGGVVIGRRGRGLSESFTVRRIVQGEGVERIFPLNSPKVVGLKVKSKARIRRAKLYYLRQRTGKGTRLRERLTGGSGN